MPYDYKPMTTVPGGSPEGATKQILKNLGKLNANMLKSGYRSDIMVEEPSKSVLIGGRPNGEREVTK